jgi:hypothetical protein
MIILYPKDFEFQNDLPDGCGLKYYDVGSYDVEEFLSGLYDTVILSVHHEAGAMSLNYMMSFINPQCHYVRTIINCDYKSANLQTLINKFHKIEDIWNEG